ncbi:MAG: zinc ribbon domain-containing protein [Candidatus Zixiibacteriota bacterium]|nr:MAG: zinc ribbon domain-containing protein [candidate division Zixibacteria bacterium]
MPIYEYKCKDCGAKFEVLVYSSDSSITCEKCGSENPERLMSGFASAAKGSNSTSSCSTGGRFT